VRDLTEEQKNEARKDLAMYLGSPPYDLDEVRRVLASGVLVRLARSKYAIAPVDLIRQIGPVTLTERHRREAARDLTRILGPTRPPGAADHRRPPSAVLDRWFLDRYLRTVGELLRDLGHRRRPEREGEP